MSGPENRFTPQPGSPEIKNQNGGALDQILQEKQNLNRVKSNYRENSADRKKVERLISVYGVLMEILSETGINPPQLVDLEKTIFFGKINDAYEKTESVSMAAYEAYQFLMMKELLSRLPKIER